jgi:hypothetical protein
VNARNINLNEKYNPNGIAAPVKEYNAALKIVCSLFSLIPLNATRKATPIKKIELITPNNTTAIKAILQLVIKSLLSNKRYGQTLINMLYFQNILVI